MMSQRALAEDYAARIEGLGPIAVQRYFAGASLRADGVQFGFVMKGVLYLKANEASRCAFEQHGCAPFSYAGASGQVTVAAYYEAPGEILDDPEELSRWAANALRAARSASKQKRAVP
ncbi:TfoX/Sxy family protein [Rhizobium sullae]|uniref:TfoX/Sxy family transcriptional regulator of competence genes n=1 Tax=Rhizobium sullae TaxID=50338 RepID=A0A4V2VAD6_RHISU|nr:TfoX/Sxy family protein [Rhizobium sullae]TCU20585.1 TfoX/Sxy family transcriptional regulator of competence genes [Rhizobium sullae]